jgi:hypothetical protein
MRRSGFQPRPNHCGAPLAVLGSLNTRVLSARVLKPKSKSYVNKSLAMGLCGLTFACAGVGVQAQSLSTKPSAATTSSPATIDERAGILKTVRGNVQLLSADGASRVASAGDVLAPIDRVMTGPDSGASVVLRDGTKIVVGPSSRLDLKEFHFDSTTQDGGMLVSLLRGSLRMITGLIGKTHPDAVRVETPTAVIGIRGTDFIVQTDAQP